MAPWKVLQSKILFSSRYLRVRQEEVRIGDGKTIPDYHVIESPTWAGIVACTRQGELILVRQYRHGHGGSSLELPAGIVEENEDFLAGAARELREETGYEADSLVPLWTCRPEPARHQQWAHFAFARGARRLHEQALDATEEIQVELHPVDRLDEIVSEMVHGVHVAALLLAAHKGLFS